MSAPLPQLTPAGMAEIKRRRIMVEEILCKAMPGNSNERRRLQDEYCTLRYLEDANV